jgi:protein-S-isoprenylcysteine O-methyltransferase Ste14
LSELFGWLLWPFLIPEKALVIVGLFILIFSAVYLRAMKKEGLVTSGLYRLIRHPQYLGMTLSTLGLTSWSVWVLQNTFGIGFLSPLQTMGVWFIELAAYIVLASIEEMFLFKNFGECFENYRTQVPFMIPLVKTKRRSIDILSSILVPTILLLVLIFSNNYVIRL